METIKLTIPENATTNKVAHVNPKNILYFANSFNVDLELELTKVHFIGKEYIWVRETPRQIEILLENEEEVTDAE